MKLTKTELKLLETGSNYEGNVHAYRVSGNGPEGGRLWYGSRETDAFQKLVKKSLIENPNYGTHTRANRGWTERTYTCNGKMTQRAWEILGMPGYPEGWSDLLGHCFWININGVARSQCDPHWTVKRYCPRTGKYLCSNPNFQSPCWMVKSDITGAIPRLKLDGD